eukprot:6010754-Prymnesium_polylepis.1
MEAERARRVLLSRNALARWWCPGCGRGCGRAQVGSGPGRRADYSRGPRGDLETESEGFGDLGQRAATPRRVVLIAKGYPVLIIAGEAAVCLAATTDSAT